MRDGGRLAVEGGIRQKMPSRYRFEMVEACQRRATSLSVLAAATPLSFRESGGSDGRRLCWCWAVSSCWRHWPCPHSMGVRHDEASWPRQ